jgi:hypothetical protein
MTTRADKRIDIGGKGFFLLSRGWALRRTANKKGEQEVACQESIHCVVLNGKLRKPLKKSEAF